MPAYRPLNVGEGFTKQTFQLHPQAWKVEAGHVLKLELLTADSTYLRNSSSPHSVQVRRTSNCACRPSIRPAAPKEWCRHRSPTTCRPATRWRATWSRRRPPRRCSAAARTRTTADSSRSPGKPPRRPPSRPTRSSTRTPPAAGAPSPAGSPARPTPSPPATPRVKAPGTTASRRATKAPKANRRVNPKRSRSTRPRPTHPRRAPTARPTTRVAAAGTRTASKCRSPPAGTRTCPTGAPAAASTRPRSRPPQTFNTSGSHEACGTEKDKAGNESSPGCLTVQVDATAPTLELNCPATALVGEDGVVRELHGLRRPVGAGQPSRAGRPDRHQQRRQKDRQHDRDRQRRPRNHAARARPRSNTRPRCPDLTAGTNPNANGLFTLSWTGADPLQYFGLTYTLQHHNHEGHPWTNVASGIEALNSTFTGVGRERRHVGVPRRRATTKGTR